MSTTSDWSRFTVRININAPIPVLYGAWTTREGIEYWFLRSSEYREAGGRLREANENVVEGDTYTWMWHGWPDDTVERGTILSANGKDQLKFSFGKAGDCSVSIKMEDEETVVELTQDNIPDDDTGKKNWHVGCKTGWTFYLANMKSVYEGGLDLRNRNVNLKSVVNS